MRDSDIKDEHGRSAEEIAAEAAQEFDIGAVVAKAAAMPDAPDQPVRPKTSLVSPMNFPKHAAEKSRIHVPDAAQPAPNMAPNMAPNLAPQIAMQAPQSTIVTPDGRPVTQVLLTQAFPQIDATHPAVQRPVTTVFATAEGEAEPPARPATRVFSAEPPSATPPQRPVSQILPTDGPAPSRPVSQILPSEEPQRPSSSALPHRSGATPDQRNPAKSKGEPPLELPQSSRVMRPKSKPAMPAIMDGHISALGPSQQVVYATEDAREAYWEAIGESDEELLSYPVTPELRGMPAWPTQMQAFRIVRTYDSVIICSEGLSDAFGPYDSRSDVNGFGLEVYIEIAGWQSMIAENIHKNWAFKAVEHIARLAAHMQNLPELLKDGQIVSVDMPRNCVPKPWVVPGVAEPAGVLLGMPQPPGRAKIKDMPLSETIVVPITPIFPEELESCVVEGPAERKALANDLLTTGAGHRVYMDRTSLR
ncbi:MAG: hypothetical protein AAF672_11495 [Pseudomonadota bacterium]